MESPFAKQLRSIIRGELLMEEDLSRYCTLRLGGPAEFLVLPEDERDLLELVSFLKEQGTNHIFLGAGSNVLIPDKGIRGVVIRLTSLANIEWNDNRVTVSAGYPLPKLVNKSIDRGLKGLEFLAGIPGTVGGALVMNAGVPEGSIGSVVVSATVLDSEGNLRELEQAELNFSYRNSLLKDQGLLVIKTVLELEVGDRDELRQLVSERARVRREKQPLSKPNAGSVFKNPEGRFAGQLLDSVGVKGLRIGDAQVAPEHANFIVNLGQATAKDVVAVMKEMRERVRKEFGIVLEPEIISLGDSWESLLGSG